jgi:uncharacterized protein (TIGR03437 family)
MSAYVQLINSDPNSQVTAYASNVYQRILLVANAPGVAGETIPITATVSTGTSLILTALSSQTCCSNPIGGLVTDNNPAQPGEIVYVLATGLGITTNQDALNTGQLPTAANNDPPQTPVDSILAGGSSGNIIFTQYVPGQLGVFQVVFQLDSSIPDDPLTQLTIAQQSFVSNVVTFNVQSGEAATSDLRPRRQLTSAKPPKVPLVRGNPHVKPRYFKRPDKKLQRKLF